MANSQHIRTLTLSQRVGAILYAAAEPVALAKLASVCNTDKDSLNDALAELETALPETGLSLVRTGMNAAVVTHPDANEDVQALTHKEIAGPLGSAALETLSIILYSTSITKREIDYIRGVNSSHVLRTLLIRGLIQKVQSHAQTRSTPYEGTLEALAHLGVARASELPDFESVRDEIQSGLSELSNEHE